MREIVNVEDVEAYKDDVAWVDEVSVTYSQNADCTECDGLQSITLTTRNNGVARFIHVKTDGWSIGNAAELTKIVDDFCIRSGIRTEKK